MGPLESKDFGSGFYLSVQVCGDEALVGVSGELDMVTAPQLRDAIAGLLCSAPTSKHVILDLSGATFVDSSGLSVIVEGYKRARANGGDMYLASPTPTVQKVLALTGISGVVPVLESVDREHKPQR